MDFFEKRQKFQGLQSNIMIPMNLSLWKPGGVQNSVGSFLNGRVAIGKVSREPLGRCSQYGRPLVAVAAKQSSWEAGSKSGFDIPGLAEFAAGVRERKKHIPSPSNQDPLLKLFDEFDLDHDGELSPLEVCKALQSRQVDITEEQASFFIQAVEDGDKKTYASRKAFPELVLHMASTYVPLQEDPHNRFSIP